MIIARIGAFCIVVSRARGKTKGGNGEAFRCAITPKVYFSFLGSTVSQLATLAYKPSRRTYRGFIQFSVREHYLGMGAFSPRISGCASVSRAKRWPSHRDHHYSLEGSGFQPAWLLQSLPS
jgi:hypothetical protein